MGDINIDIDVHGAEKVIPAFNKGLDEGLQDAGNYLLRLGKSNARDYVMGAGRVWNKKVKRGFTTGENEFSRYNHWQGHIRNTAPHAMIVEKGLAPAGEITGATPSVEDILPWVESEITPNAAAQASADAANLNNWSPEWEMLADQYGTANVIAAFAIATSIRDKGYPGIHFMKRTEADLRSQSMNVKNKVEKEINKEFRKAGLQ